MNLFRIFETMSAAAPEELCCLGMSACWVSPVAMSYTMGTIMLTGSWGTGIRWVSCSCEAEQFNTHGEVGLCVSNDATQICNWLWRANDEALPRLTKKSILDLSTTAMVPGGAMGGALGGMVRQNWTFHFSCAAWSGNCRETGFYYVLVS